MPRRDGTADEAHIEVAGVENVPGGVAVMKEGLLLIACYEPSRIYRHSERHGLPILIESTRAPLFSRIPLTLC